MGLLLRRFEREQLTGSGDPQPDGLGDLVGVPCGVVQRPSDLFHDPQLAHRGHFWPLDHPEIGRIRYNGASFKLSETPAYPRSAAPLLGAHTREVLTQLLGYSDSEVDQLGYEQVLQ